MKKMKNIAFYLFGLSLFGLMLLPIMTPTVSGSSQIVYFSEKHSLKTSVFHYEHSATMNVRLVVYYHATYTYTECHSVQLENNPSFYWKNEVHSFLLIGSIEKLTHIQNYATEFFPGAWIDTYGKFIIEFDQNTWEFTSIDIHN